MNNLLLSPQKWNRELAADEIHVWWASLAQPASRFQRLLSAEERMKAERFHFEKDRECFIVRRGILRTLLSDYLGVEPGYLQFRYEKNEKPVLTDAFGLEKIHFNLSHSEGLALYAFTHDHEIGLDIEYIRDISEMEQIVDSEEKTYRYSYWASFFKAGI